MERFPEHWSWAARVFIIYMKTVTGREDPVVTQFEAVRAAAYTQEELTELGGELEDLELDVVSYFYGYTDLAHAFGGRVYGGNPDEIAAAIRRFNNAQLRGDEAELYNGLMGRSVYR